MCSLYYKPDCEYKKNTCNCHRRAKTCCICCKGERGGKGEQGPKGETGTQGEQGERGLDGEKGEQGPAGSQGETGPEGLWGEQGERGLDGEKGEQGSAGPQGETGAVGPKGETGYPGIEGEAGSNQFAYYYAVDQTIAKDGKVKFLEGTIIGPFSLINDSTEIRISRDGSYFIEAAWSAKDEGALLLALALNDEKIPFMSYVLGTARDNLISAIPGSIILKLEFGDVLSIINYDTETTLAIPKNNTPEGTLSNAAATISIIKLG